ncbi:hypothetical protein [Marinicrinis lubricantis]|uniref:Zinc ribbon domain-containing protein n=1 Tax=Marinicrinis lubricantis TaxID=2086470 RepID=A0ABW1IQY6_9BACL
MKVLSTNCPNCGANIELDKTSELALCGYCGTRVVMKEEDEKKPVTMGANAPKSKEESVKRAPAYLEKGKHLKSLSTDHSNQRRDALEENFNMIQKLKSIKKIKYLVGGILLGIALAFFLVIVDVILISVFDFNAAAGVPLILVTGFGALFITPRVVYIIGRNKYYY